MKKVFLFRMSEDGNSLEVFTNIKALYNGIVESNYQCKTIDRWDWKENKYVQTSFNYNNLVASIRTAQSQNRMFLCSISCANGASIDVNELIVRTK